MESSSNLNATMINSNNNCQKDSNNENEFDQNSSGNFNQTQNLQQNRRNTQKDDDEDNFFHNTSDPNIASIADTYQEIEGVRYGKCKWFNVAKGWGFITPNEGGKEVFVHQSVIQMSGFRSLGEQEDVEYECQFTERGLVATRVSGRQGADCHGSTFRPRTSKRHRRVRCYNCGEFANHIALKCHLGPQPKLCHLCKQDGHLFANCPTKKNQTSKSLKQHSTNEEASSTSENDTNIKPEVENASR